MVEHTTRMSRTKMAVGAELKADLSNWNPNDPQTWDSKRAWLTLWVTTYSMILGFCTWYIVSTVAPHLNKVGFDLTKEQLYWLTSMPGLAAGVFRLIWMFLPPVIGTRKLVTFSSLLLLIPMLGWTLAVRDATTPYSVLLLLSLACGIGGGIFSGYMPSTGYFFPKSKSGTALGTQAGVGNFGMSIIQILGPWVMGFGLLGTAALTPQMTVEGPVFLHNIGLVLVPWVVLAAVLAWFLLRDVPIKANFRQQIDIFGNRNTWFLMLIYLMTFGAFSGFAAQFALLINNTYGISSPFAHEPNVVRGATYAFLPPLIASAVRVIWGPLCDKFGGAIWTFVSGVGMTISIFVAASFLNPTEMGDYKGFLAAMFAMFFFAGIGNAGTFKQMPMIMPPRQAGGVIGFTAAIAAFGPFIVGVALANLDDRAFFIGCGVFFVFCTALIWVMYARPKAPYPG
jgi:NNP family nitrate/nitrite transporter-like MFS transporter